MVIEETVIRYFKVDKVDAGGLEVSVLRLVKELVLSTYVELGDDLPGSMSKYVEDALNEGCDYVYVRSCIKSLCSEVLEAVRSRSFSYLVSPKLSRLLGLSMIYGEVGEGKEVDKLFESQMVLKTYTILDDVYVFEGDLVVRGCRNCVGVLIITDSGIRVLMLNEACKTMRSKKVGKRAVLRKRKRKGRRRSKKKG